jgi:enamine deaminase RidA (YjgF/YER057c/UK114 family)
MHATRRNDRTLVSSGSPWEPVVGYSRALRVGDRVLVAGTTAVDANGNVVGEGDIGAQARFIFDKIGMALAAAGSRLADVVRTRIYVTDMARWEAVGLAHGEVFKDVRPVSTLVEVSKLIDPRLLVEIEAEAVVPVATGA